MGIISFVFVPDRDIANSDEAISDKELFASKCLCLRIIFANLALLTNKTKVDTYSGMISLSETLRCETQSHYLLS